MVVCHCYGVTDREIRAAVRRGDGGTLAGTGCGGCRPAVDAIVAAEAHACVAPATRALPVIGAVTGSFFVPSGAAARPD